MTTGKSATEEELPLYRCLCCGKRHRLTRAMIDAAISGLVRFSREADIEEEAATTLLLEVFQSQTIS